MRRFLYVVIFLSFSFFLLPNPVHSQQSPAAAQVVAGGPIIKPLLWSPYPDNPGKNKLDVYKKDDRFNVLNINEGDTRVVDIYFPIDQDPKKGKYYFCYKSDRNECDTKTGKNLGDQLEGEGSFGLDLNEGNTPPKPDDDVRAEIQKNGGNPDFVVRTRVCGAGESDLQATNKCNDPSSVWFHSGKLYRVGLYQKIMVAKGQDQYNEVGEAVFYVNHYYPNVFLSVNGQERLIATTNSDPSKNPPGIVQVDKDENGLTDAVIVKSPIYPINNLEVKLTGRKPKETDQNNNYRIKLEGTDVAYSEGGCTAVKNSNLGFKDAENNPSIKFDKVRVGSYFLDIAEQVNERTVGKSLAAGGIAAGAIIAGGAAEVLTAGLATPITLGAIAAGSSFGVIKVIGTDCDTDFHYWRIPISVVPEIDSQGKKTKSYLIKIPTLEVEQDPGGLDPGLHNRLLFGGRAAPCSEGTDENGKETSDRSRIELCSKIPVALFGNISTDPAGFITDVFSKLLSLAGIIALVLTLVAGYRLMISAGDKEKLANARGQLTSAIIGLLFIIFSFVILQLIASKVLQIPGFS